MDDKNLANIESAPAIKLRRFSWRRALLAFATLALTYVILAYFFVPSLWIVYAHRHPSFENIPRITYTGDDHPGDPLNVGLIGTEAQVKKIMVAAKWYPADPLTLRSCLEIAEASVLKRPYEAAPVSNLFLFGRKQDLAFEKAVDNNPRARHHVRFWRTPLADTDGRPVWVSAAMYDRRVGLSHTTGQITHHTGADVDEERDFLFHDLEQTGQLAEVFTVDDFHEVRQGTNGGGDPWHTDGKLVAGVIAP
jgi:hypothetical protein